MNGKTGKLDQIILWLLVTGGLLSLLLYGLSFIFAKPTIETITTDAPNVNINDNKIREVKYEGGNR